MPSFVIALTSSTSTSTPSFSQLAGAAREFHGIEHVRRLVDEFARDDHAIDDVGCGREGLSRGGDVVDRDRNVGAAARRSRRPSSWSCSGRIYRRAAGCPTRSPPPARGFIAPSGSSATMVTASLAALSLPAVHAAELEKILLLDIGRLAGADHDQALRLDSLRRQDIERRSALALELVGGRRPLDGVGSLPQRLPASPRRTSTRRRKTPPERRAAPRKMGQSRP